MYSLLRIWSARNALHLFCRRNGLMHAAIHGLATIVYFRCGSCSNSYAANSGLMPGILFQSIQSILSVSRYRLA